MTPPVQSAESRVRNFDEVYLPWTADMAMREASRCLHCDDRPCVDGCPLHNDIPRVLWLTERGEFQDAASVLLETNNFSEICSRVCPQSRQCEGACRTKWEGGTPIAIGRIEGFLADRHRKEGGWTRGRPPRSGHRAAVVGAGPAGLTVAEVLALEGHCVSVFDQWPDGGGVLRYGIPRFKLDHALVGKRLSYLRALGVEFVFNARIGGDRGVDQLLGEGFEAVFLGTGTGVPVPIDLPGSDLSGVYQAVPFLVSGNVEQNRRPSDLEDPPVVGRRVVVVGGGDTAVYCGRTAVRMGAERVTCCCSSPEDETAGNPVDRVFAREEGVTFRWAVSPLRILGDSRGHVVGVEFASRDPGEKGGPVRPARSGVDGGSTFTEGADTVLVAEGFLPDPSLAEETSGLSQDHFGLVVVDPATGRTSRDRVWAGGDNVLGSSLVARAVSQGRIAARDIHQRLQSGSI